MNDMTADRQRAKQVLFASALLAAAADIAAALVLARLDLGLTGRILAAVLPMPFNIVVIVLMVKSIRRLDEFQRRVNFEAVAVSFISTGFAVLLYGYLQKADILGPLNVGLVWVPMTAFYCIGYLVAARHYQ